MATAIVTNKRGTPVAAFPTHQQAHAYLDTMKRLEIRLAGDNIKGIEAAIKFYEGWKVSAAKGKFNWTKNTNKEND